MKWVILSVAVFTVLTVTLAVKTLTGPQPKLGMQVAAQIFDRYPHWQRSTSPSREIAFDPGLARAHAKQFSTPPLLADDPFLVWQPARQQDVIVEFGIGNQISAAKGLE